MRISGVPPSAALLQTLSLNRYGLIGDVTCVLFRTCITFSSCIPGGWPMSSMLPLADAYTEVWYELSVCVSFATLAVSRLSRWLALLRISESCPLRPCDGYRLPALDFGVAKGEPGSFRKIGPRQGRQAQMMPMAGSKEYQMMAPNEVPGVRSACDGRRDSETTHKCSQQCREIPQWQRVVQLN